MMRILHVFSILDVGGMETYVMNMYRHMDRSRIQFDFLVHHGRKGVYEEEIESLGGKIFHTTVLDDFNIAKYRRELRRIYQENNYQIVHGHLSSMALWYLGEAEQAGVGCRILHCHCPGYTKTIKGYLRHFLFQFSPRHANVRFACSEEAGRYQFKHMPFEVLPNGIDVLNFRFNKDRREEIRKQLKLKDEFVIGHVGRFFPEKNHVFMLNLFEKIVRRIPDAKLMLLGDGPLMENIREKVSEKGLENNVIFMGLQRDCAPYYSAMDCFILPSVYEGLPLSGIEAQCAELPCIFTAAASAKLKVSQNVAFIPVGDDDGDRWVETIMGIYRDKADRSVITANVDKYDVRINAQKMAERYVLMGAEKV